jgi:concanavalin A-like lectin/glucanase superfamily protein
MGLREQAKLDARAILEDDSGFAWPVTLTSPLGEVTSLRGFTTDVGQTIDPETGQAVAGRRASFAVSLSSLPAMPEAVAERNRKPWLATFADSAGVVASWKVIDVLPDRAAGVVVLILEAYKSAIVRLTGALALPRLRLAGSVAATVAALAGALALPSPRLAGSVAPTVAALAGALALPRPPLQLAGSLAWFTLRGALVLPPPRLAGSISPTVALGAALSLPEVQLSGSVAPNVTIGAALTLPEVQLSGSFTTGAVVQSAWLRVANATLVSGDVSSLPDALNSNPAVQTVAARRPTLELAANGLPCMRFATNDVLSWPITAQSSAVNQAGYGLWIKADALSATQRLIFVSTSTGGASGAKLRLSPASNGALATVVSSDGSTTKTITSPPNALDTGWHFLTCEYDKDGASDAAKLVLTIDGVALGTITGAATLGALFAATGNILIGNGQDTTSASAPFSGLIGPNIYAFNAKTPTATTGLLSTAERAAFMNFEKPT